MVILGASEKATLRPPLDKTAPTVDLRARVRAGRRRPKRAGKKSADAQALFRGKGRGGGGTKWSYPHTPATVGQRRLPEDPRWRFHVRLWCRARDLGLVPLLPPPRFVGHFDKSLHLQVFDIKGNEPNRIIGQRIDVAVGAIMARTGRDCSREMSPARFVLWSYLTATVTHS